MWRGLTGTLGIWAIGALALRFALVQPEVCPAVTAETALGAARASAAWMARVQRADGTFLYEYDVAAGAQIPGYNVVRHAGILLALYQLAGADPSAGSQAAGDRGLAWAQAQLLEHDDWSALRDPDEGSVESGGTALLLDALAQRRIATGDAAYDVLMHRLARFLLVLTQPDGGVLLSWDASAGHPDPVQRSPYATGQVLWSYALMQRFFPAEGWDLHARRVAEYLSLRRDTVEKQKFPPWADQWAAYGLAEMAAWPSTPGGTPQLTPENLTYVRSLAQRFGFLVRVDSRRTDSWWDRLLHAGKVRGAGAGTWLEGVDSLWRIARIDPRVADLEAALAERGVCSAGMERDRQTTAAQAAKTKSPAVAEGAWVTDGVTRMDDQQHTLSGLLRSIDILRAHRARP